MATFSTFAEVALPASLYSADSLAAAAQKSFLPGGLVKTKVLLAVTYWPGSNGQGHEPDESPTLQIRNVRILPTFDDMTDADFLAAAGMDAFSEIYRVAWGHIKNAGHDC